MIDGAGALARVLWSLQFSQLWHPRDDRDPPHRWLRDIVARAATRRTEP